MLSLGHRRNGPPEQARGYQVNAFSHYARHAMAAVSALVISGFLLVNSLAVSSTEVHSVIGILA